MRAKAVILMIVILLQPFNAIAAAGTMAMLHDAPLAADSEHCEDHANPADSIDPPADAASPISDECFDECQVCASAAGAFLLTADSAGSGFVQSGFPDWSSQPPARALIDLLYRPPIRS
jgi:hypothetical protein